MLECHRSRLAAQIVNVHGQGILCRRGSAAEKGNALDREPPLKFKFFQRTRGRVLANAYSAGRSPAWPRKPAVIAGPVFQEDFEQQRSRCSMKARSMRENADSGNISGHGAWL